jgi:hypothetical protein
MNTGEIFRLSAERHDAWAHGRALASGNATLNATWHRGIDLTGSIDLRGELGAEAGSTLFAMLQAEGRASAGLSLKAGFPLDLFGESGVVARLRAQAAASAALQAKVGMRSEGLANDLNRVLPLAWRGLAKIFLDEFKLSAGIWGVASFSAELVAEAALVGHLIPVGGVEPGFTCSFQYAAGWGGGAGYDFKVNFGLTNPARLFDRLGIHTADLIERELRVRIPQLPSQAERALPYVRLLLPLAYQAAFGYGAALAEAARTGATPNGRAVTDIFLRHARTLVVQALLDLALGYAEQSLAHPETKARVAALTGDAASRAGDALKKVEDAFAEVRKDDSSLDDWFKFVLALLDALIGAEPYLAAAQEPRWNDTLALIWAAAVVIRRLTAGRDANEVPPTAATAPAPGAVAVYVAGQLGRSAGMLGESDALAYLIGSKNLWVQELRSQLLELVPAFDLIARIVAPASGSPLLEALFDPALTADNARRDAVLAALVAQAGPVIEQELLPFVIDPLEHANDEGVRDLARLVVRPMLRCLVRVILPAAVQRLSDSRSQLLREQISAALLQTIARLLVVSAEMVAKIAAHDGAIFLRSQADAIATGRATRELERIIGALSGGAVSSSGVRNLLGATEVAELVRLAAETIEWWDANERQQQFEMLVELITLGLHSGNKTIDDIWDDLEHNPNTPPLQDRLEAYAREMVNALVRLARHVFERGLALLVRAGERFVADVMSGVNTMATTGLQAAREVAQWLASRAADLQRLLNELNAKLEKTLSAIASRLSALSQQLRQLAGDAVGAVRSTGWALVEAALAGNIVFSNLPRDQRDIARRCVLGLYNTWFDSVGYLLEEPLRMFQQAADWVRDALNRQVPGGVFDRAYILNYIRNEALKLLNKPLSLPLTYNFKLLDIPITIDLSDLRMIEVRAETVSGTFVDVLLSNSAVQQGIDALVELYRQIRLISQQLGMTQLAYQSALTSAEASLIVNRMVTSLPLVARIPAPAEQQLARNKVKLRVEIPGANATFVSSSLGMPTRVKLLVNGTEHSYAPSSWFETPGGLVYEAWLVPSGAGLAPLPVLPDVRLLEVALPHLYTYTVEQDGHGIQRLRAAEQATIPFPGPGGGPHLPSNGGIVPRPVAVSRLETLRARVMTAQMDPLLSAAIGSTQQNTSPIQPVIAERIGVFAATAAERATGTRWVDQADVLAPLLETIVARPGANQMQVVVADGAGRTATISRTFLLI